MLVGLVNAAILVANEELAGAKAKRAAAAGGDADDSGTSGKRSKPDKVHVDETVIYERINALDALIQEKSYSRKKTVFHAKFNEFLASLTPSKTFGSATPMDIRKFLVWMEKDGKTRLHVLGCEFRGVGSGVLCSCECPITMAWGTLDSKVGMLRALYRDQGYGTEWGPNGSNPAASPEVKRHLSACALEQSRASVSVKQAVPLFFDKVQALSRYMEYHMGNDMAQCQKLLYIRDITFFRMVIQTGDRANDLGSVQTDDIYWMEKGGDYILKLCQGKTCSVARPRYVPLFRSEDRELCPVTSLTVMMNLFGAAGADLKHGYVFRPLSDDRNTFINSQMSSSGINARLQMHLERASMYSGETIHGARRGLALLLTSMGVGDADICRHLGWYSKKMCWYYTSRQTSVRDALSQSVERESAFAEKNLARYCVPENRVFL